MAEAQLSMSLEDIAANTKPSGGRGGGRGGRGKTPAAGGKRNRNSGRGSGGGEFVKKQFARSQPYEKRESRADGAWDHGKFHEIAEDDDDVGYFQEAQPVAPVVYERQPVVASGDLRAAIKKPISLGAKLFVSNLNPDILEDELQQLFEAQGKVKYVKLHYDDKGVSQGTAEVRYISRADAATAIDEFNGRQLDGLELRIEYITAPDAIPEPAPAAAQPSVAFQPHFTINTSRRQTSRPRYQNDEVEEAEDASTFFGLASNSNRRRGGDRGRGARDFPRQDRFPRQGGGGRRDRGDRGGRSAGGRGRPQREKKVAATEADLDAEMDAYLSKAKKKN